MSKSASAGSSLLESSLNLSTPTASDEWSWECESPIISEMVTFWTKSKNIDYRQTMNLKTTSNANGRVTIWLVEPGSNIHHKVQQISNMDDDEIVALCADVPVEVEIADRVREGIKFAYTGWFFYKRIN